MKRFSALLLALLTAFSLLCLSVSAVSEDSAAVVGVTADKQQIYDGTTVNFTVTLTSSEEVAGISFELAIPEGMSYISGSAKLADNVQTTLGAHRVEFSEAAMKFAAVGGGKFSSSEPVELLTFSCKVDKATPGDIVNVSVANLDIIKPVSNGVIDDVSGSADNCSVSAILRGDFDNSGKLSLADSVYLKKHLTLPQIFRVDQSVDTNGDGKSNLTDAVYLKKHLTLPSIFPLY